MGVNGLRLMGERPWSFVTYNLALAFRTLMKNDNY